MNESLWRAAMEFLDDKQSEMIQLLTNLVEMETLSADKKAVSRLGSGLIKYKR